MKKVIKKILCHLIPISCLRQQLCLNKKIINNELVRKYLYGLNGIEIGGSGKSFGLDNQEGSYANVDIIDAKTRAKNKGWAKSQLVNILSSGDDLPFKDNVIDYVFSSHVIEHFFDPIRAIKEWYRVFKKGGYIFMIIPHKERTFDKNRDITTYEELMDRHNNNVLFSEYAIRTKGQKLLYENDEDKDHHLLVKEKPVPSGWERFSEYDFGHHWSVWDNQAFLDLCAKMNWNVVEYKDVDNKPSNEFIIVLQK